MDTRDSSRPLKVVGMTIIDWNRYELSRPLNRVDPSGLYGIIVPLPPWAPPVPIVVFPPTSMQGSTNTGSSLLQQLGQINSQLDSLNAQQRQLQQQLGGANQCGQGTGSSEQIQQQLNQILQQQNNLFNQFLNLLNPFAPHPAPPRFST